MSCSLKMSASMHGKPRKMKLSALHSHKNSLTWLPMTVRLSPMASVLFTAQASVYDVAKFLPAYAGKLVQSELDVLSTVATEPAHPYVVVLGGAKVSDKLGVIEALADKADKVIIGGGMCYTMLAAQGYNVQKSLLQEDQI